MAVMMGARDEDTVSSLAGRLSRLNKQLAPKDQQRIKEVAGVDLSTIVHKLINAINADTIEDKATEIAGGVEPTDAQRTQAQEELVGEAASVLTGELVNLLDTIRRDKEQSIDHEHLDTLIRAEWDGDAIENARSMVQEFSQYLEAHRDEIEALTIFYGQPYRRRELTFAMMQNLLEKLKSDKPKLAPYRVWNAYTQLDEYKNGQPVSELMALVSLVRRVCGIDSKIAPYAETVRKNFQDWIMKRHSGGGEKFTEEQMDWLRMIRDHIMASFHVERDDLDLAPFNAKGGLGRMYQLFGSQMDDLIHELNEVLAA
jgi:type I restriction enzyme R subunit